MLFTLRQKKKQQSPRRKNTKANEAQTILEYTVVIGVIMVVLYAMGPMFKRGVQSMIKLVADQIGNQQNSDQRFDESGHLEESYSFARAMASKRTIDYLGNTRYEYDTHTKTDSNQKLNLGFTELKGRK